MINDVTFIAFVVFFCFLLFFFTVYFCVSLRRARATSHCLKDSLNLDRPSCNINKPIVCAGMDGKWLPGWSSCLLNNVRAARVERRNQSSPRWADATVHTPLPFSRSRPGMAKVDDRLNLNAQWLTTAAIFLFRPAARMKTEHIRLYIFNLQ